MTIEVINKSKYSSYMSVWSDVQFIKTGGLKQLQSKQNTFKCLINSI